MKVHTGLIWIECSPEIVQELLARRAIKRLIVANPATGWLAIKPQSLTAFKKALQTLGQTPREIKYVKR